ncbi:MAG: efflux transporter periplasmic adaptor subunit [Micavibrio sp.]|nr:efflux transporter periplasmic adaptor subunit [Micavibrio sp.]|tara:strand:+ start:2802 stop:3968 length:1167 start_codon:yes stop_codon:yes gene_type:complete
MRKTIITISSLVIIAALSTGAYLLFSPQNETIAEHSPITKVKLGNIESVVTAQGTLEPKDYVDVGAQVSGEVIKLAVEIGDNVKMGELIAEIDPDVYEAQVKASEAALKMLAAQKAEQEALIKQAQWKYERNKKLYEDKAVSKETFEDAEINLDVAKANLLALEAQIEQSQSSLDEDKTNLNYTKIYAPMNGDVVDQAVEEGETINANQTTPTIVQVANLDVMTAKAEVAEADVMKLSEGMPVYFTTLGSGDRRWEGKVRQILPTPEEINDVVLYNVLVDVENTDRSLLPGMTTQMFFVLKSASNVPIIPVSALGKPLKDQNTEQGEAYQVSTLGAKGPEARTVIVSISDRTHAAIASGLEVDESVFTKAVPDSEAPNRRGLRGLGRL